MTISRRTVSSSLKLLLLAALFAGRVGARFADNDNKESVVLVDKNRQRALRNLLQSSTIAELVVADAELETLEAAVVAAGLVDALNAPGNFTVFAPINQAFACLEGSPGCPGSDYLGRLLTPEFKLHLQNYLAYHVTEGMVLASALTNGQELTMLNGETLKISIIEGAVFLTNPLTTFAIVTDTDILASNGAIHKVDGTPVNPSFVGSDLVDTLASNPDYSTLVSLVQKAGLEDALRTAPALTVLAPDNAAFEALPQAVLDAVLADPDLLASVLTYHVIEGVAPSTGLASGAVQTLNGETLDVIVDDSGVAINDVPVVVANVLSRNGIIHGIQSVLVPDVGEEHAPVAAPSPSFPTFSAPYSVYGPTTWQARPVPPPVASAPAVSVPTTPYVVYGPTTWQSNPVAPAPTAPPPTPTNTAESSIVDLVVEDDMLGTLEAAVVAAGLVDVLSGTGPFTVFGPVDSAFAAVDQDFLNLLLLPEFKVHLENLLFYHVAEGAVLSTDLSDNQLLTMLNGETLTVAFQENGIYLTNPLTTEAYVLAPDIDASNGVVHRIAGAPLLPSWVGTDVVDVLAANPNYTTLVSLVQQAGLEDALRSGVVTVVAPDNAAFDSLPQEMLNAVLTDSDLLSSVLSYHVIGAVTPSAQLTTGSVATLNGDTIDVVVSDLGVTLDGVAVMQPDIVANNAIIHGIGSVLIPDQEEMMAEQGIQLYPDSDSVDSSTLDFVEEISETRSVPVWTAVFCLLFAARLI